MVTIEANTLINRNSRYTDTKILSNGDQFYMDLPKRQEIIPSTKDQYITIDCRYEGRLDLISSDYFQTPQFWWVIASRNRIIDTLSLPVDLQVIVPSKETLFQR